MKTKLTLTLLLCLNLTTSLVYAAPDPHRNVILITVDGVPEHYFFGNNTKFQRLWQKYVKLGELAGGDTGRTMQTASIPMSLPSYMTIMSGKVQNCFDNFCKRIKQETVFDELAQRLHLQRYQQAVFASWPTIADAASLHDESVVVNAGNGAFVSPITQQADPFMRQLNYYQERMPAEWSTLTVDRFDEFTYQQGKHYLLKRKPRTLWLSFLDADEAAHAGNKIKQLTGLHLADRNIDDLLTTLKSMPDYTKRATIIVTTDHGRGRGAHWTDHGKAYPYSKKTFLFVLKGESLLAGKRIGKRLLTHSNYSTASIRGLIESVML